MQAWKGPKSTTMKRYDKDDYYPDFYGQSNHFKITCAIIILKKRK